jgi:hypothetical protein
VSGRRPKKPKIQPRSAVPQTEPLGKSSAESATLGSKVEVLIPSPAAPSSTTSPAPIKPKRKTITRTVTTLKLDKEAQETIERIRKEVGVKDISQLVALALAVLEFWQLRNPEAVKQFLKP